MYNSSLDTIAAVATGSGGAISVIRVSGSRALEVCDSIFEPVSGKPLSHAKGYTLHYGTVKEGGEVIDDVIVSVFRAPRSYTGEEMVEISCHGSSYIRHKIMALLTSCGARPATAGEFTMRAFMAGKLDLSQAEAVADIIASEDRASHAIAINQMRGGYSEEFRILREELLELVALLELELDFSEEDVQFADRGNLTALLEKILAKINSLTASYALNNTIKEGVPVVIAGEPNTGKSTLLNALIKEDRAMVSEIAGTTRDIIEETHVIDGVRFRFTDTAGLRETPDRLESMGIERARGAISRSRILLYLTVPSPDGTYNIPDVVENIASLGLTPETIVYLLLNKTDVLEKINKPDGDLIREQVKNLYGLRGIHLNLAGVLSISAKMGKGIDQLKHLLSQSIDTGSVFSGETIVTNSRHYEALVKSADALERAMSGLSGGLPADLLSEDIRDALYHTGTITGEITSDEVRSLIFGRFCIGK